MVAAAMVGAAVVGAAGSAYASNQQKSAANKATNLQQGIYNQNQANLSPYMQQGSGALSKLADLEGTSGNTSAPGYGSLTSNFTAQDYLNNQDPGYQFQLQQGQQALQNSQAADSGVLSGAALKGLIGYNQGMAATGYQNAYNRWQTTNSNNFTRLSSLASLGENAAAGAGNMGVASGANMANSITGAGNAAAAGTVGATNAVTGSINNGMGYYMLSNLLNQRTTMPVNSSDPYGYGSGQDLIAQFGGG
jgi:hypothetical protein